jgi:HK97 family phage portal protein
VRTPLGSTPSLLRSPAGDMTLPAWLYQIVVSLLLRGNAYGKVVARDAGGVYPTAIAILNPDEVRVTMGASGALVFTHKGAEIPSRDVFHIAGMTLPGSPLGLSPITYASPILRTAAAAAQFGRGFFEDGAHPSALLTTANPINQTQAREIKDRFLASVKGREPAVFGAGLTYTAVTVSPEESQFLETQRFSLEQIARMFKVPAEMIGGSRGPGMTYSNVTSRSLDFLTYCVQPWLSRVESAITPLIPGAQHVLFDTSPLLRMTDADRWNVTAVRLKNGALTINEVRSDDGLPAVPWGDEPFIPSIAPAAAAAEVKTLPAAQALEAIA